MKRLKELRLEKNLYQKDVASVLGIDRTTYVKYEREQSEPNYDTLQQLADFFDVSIDYLLGRTATKNPPSAIEGENNIAKEIIEGFQEGKAMIAGKGKDGIDTIPVSDEEFEVMKNMLEAMRKAKAKDKD